MNADTDGEAAGGVESAYAWRRLGVALAISTIGGVGMWSFIVALPAIQADFAVDRAQASLPFTFAMLGFGGGGVVMGRLADRYRRRGAVDARARWRWERAMSRPVCPPACGRSRSRTVS